MISISGYVLCHSSTTPLLYIMALPVTSTPPIPSDVTLSALTSPFITTAFVVSYMVSPSRNTFGKTTSAGQQNALTSPSGVGVIPPLQIRSPRIITLIFFIVCKIFYYLCVAAVGDAPARATELIYFPAYRRRQSVTLLPSALCRDCFTLMRDFSNCSVAAIGEALDKVCQYLGFPEVPINPIFPKDSDRGKQYSTKPVFDYLIELQRKLGMETFPFQGYHISHLAIAFQRFYKNLVAKQLLPEHFFED